jgi:cation diffusion facilitator family transporter
MAGGGKTSGTTGMWLALGGYTLLFGLKLAAYFWTHLGIMFAEAMHSTADMLIVGFLLIATYMSKRPADSSFRFGYGRAQNIAALVAATIFISFTSFETLREAVPRLFEKVGAEGAALSATTFAVAIGVLLVSIVVSGIPFIPLLRNKNRSAAEKAQFIEVINDELALVAALIGIVFVNAGFALADPIASCVVAIIIAVNAVILWRENAVTLMGESPEEPFYNMVRETALAVPGALATHGVIAEKTGEQIHLSMHVEVERGTVIEEADAVADEVRKRLEAQVPDLYVVVHVDPADAQHSDRQ